MGVSFVSSAQACSNAEQEIPDPPTAFDGLVQSAEKAWREKLSVVSVGSNGNGSNSSNDSAISSAVSLPRQRAFWSGLYRNMLSPQNYTGENPRWDSGIPYFDSYYW